jgi:hypothetical protein
MGGGAAGRDDLHVLQMARLQTQLTAEDWGIVSCRDRPPLPAAVVKSWHK